MDMAARKRTSSHGALPRGTHPSPLSRELNIDALRLTPIDTTDADGDGSAVSSTSSPSLSRSGSASSRRRRRLSGLSISNIDTPFSSPATSPLLGSYKHSLLSGRMAASPPSTFTLTLSVNSLPPFRNFFVPPKLDIPFDAQYYEINGPWVGAIYLEEAPELRTPMFENEGGYRVPPKGQVQLVIKNQLGTIVKILVVPYDLKDMPPGSQAPMRRLWYGEAIQEHTVESQFHFDKDKEDDTDKDVPPREVLRYAVHLKFVCPPQRPTPQPRPRAHSAGHAAPHRGPFSKFAMTSISSAKVERETVDSDEGDLSSHSAGEGASISRRSSGGPRSKSVRGSSTDPRKIFLSGELRLVFAPRVPDEEEMVRAESEEGNVRDRYFTYDGPPPLQPRTSS